jgi:hypothetical protein
VPEKRASAEVAKGSETEVVQSTVITRRDVNGFLALTIHS